ncbi:MAG: hypothetical protein RBR87_06875 [Bacteroidales bacterium]|jgi:hypothetical protein|nr:hypothetical protein [Bacteroidales bacterium]
MKKAFLFVYSLLIFISSCSAGNTDAERNSMNSSQLIKTIKKGKAILIKDMIITDDLDFTRVAKHEIFSSSLETASIDVSVTFLNCIFMGKVTANGVKSERQVRVHFGRNLSFEACDFRQEVNFDNIIVDGEVNFTGAIFNEQARFNNVHFKGKNNWFTAITSEKYFSMQEALIHGAFDFFKAIANAKLSFQSSDFGGVARFSDLECVGSCDFSLVRFRADALFTYSNFSSDFRMANALILGRLDANSCEFQSDAYFSASRFFGAVNFSKSLARGVLDFNKAKFYMNETDFSDFSLLSPDQLNIKDAKVIHQAIFSPFETDYQQVKTN